MTSKIIVSVHRINIKDLLYKEVMVYMDKIVVREVELTATAAAISDKYSPWDPKYDGLTLGTHNITHSIEEECNRPTKTSRKKSADQSKS